MSSTLAELFSPTFFIFLGILVLVVALMVVYFESKMRDQNHKISSMLSLVSTLAEDINHVKIGLHNLSMSGGGYQENLEQPTEPLENYNNVFVQNNSHLINVSDDEDSEEEEDSDEGEDGDEEEDSDDEVNQIEYIHDGIIYDNITEKKSNVKILQLNVSNNDYDEEDDEDRDEDDDNDSDIADIDEDTFEEINNVEYENVKDLDDFNDELSISELHEVIEETPSDNILNEEKDNNTSLNLSSDDFKRISINLGEDSQVEHIDYKKLQLPKLRSIAVEKGLTTNSEAAKLKKQDLLKMLETE
jgi:hypothetical protein